jgi:carboxyl-terminal processing protease
MKTHDHSLLAIPFGFFVSCLSSVAHAERAQYSLSDDDNRLIREFTQTIATIQKDYIEPVSLNTLINSAITGMYQEAGEQPPPPNKTDSIDENSFKHLQRMPDALQYLHSKHPQLTNAVLFKVASERMAQVDKQSRFANEDDYESSLAAVGLEVRKTGEDIVIVNLVPGSPAIRSGIHRGDTIEEIDSVSVKGAELSDVVKRLRGKPGSTALLKLARAGQGSWSEHITREKITFTDIACPAVRNGVAYIHIRHFVATSASNVTMALSILEKQQGPLTGLVLDLRDNDGGILASAIGVADLFLEKGLIVSTAGRALDSNLRFNTREVVKPYGKLPMVVLVNRNTSSGAEAVAAALQDHKRAIIAGWHTFGSGSVRTVYKIGDRSLLLTTARLVRPSGGLIEDGVEPDMLLDGKLHAVTERPWQPCIEESVQEESAEIAFAADQLPQLNQ